MSPWMHVAGWVLVHFMWQGAVIAAAAAFMLRVCRTHSASLRYAIACGAMATMLVGVIATAIVVEPPRASAAVRRDLRTPVTQTARPGVLLPIAMSDPAPESRRFTAERIEPALPWIVSAWLLGVACLLARTAAGWWRVRKIHTLACSSVRSRWQEAANRIASRIGLSRAIRIAELPHIDVPIVAGCLRPVVILPIAVLSSLNAAQVEAILAHELAHVRRHDYLANLMQTLAETVLFYHPAVWWVSARIRDEREHCCDDVAIAVCGDPVTYAAALTELEAIRSSDLTLATAATGGSLLNRVRRILHVDVTEDSRAASLMIGLIIVATLAVLATNVIAQAQQAARPKFEVASVRENTSGSNQVSIGMQPGGRFGAHNIPLVTLIRSAYRLQDSQLVGAPAWIETTRYDITAKAEGDLPPSSPFGPPSTGMLMLQSLLEDRFKLKVHSEVREQPIFALVAPSPMKLGPTLKHSNVDCEAIRDAGRRGGAQPAAPKRGEWGWPQCGTSMGFGEIRGGARPLTLLASMLAQVVRRSVVDRTGLTGAFDFDLRFTPELPPGAPTDKPFLVNGVEIDPHGPSIFTAVQEQLGLKLDATRGPVDVLVVDHVERPAPD